MESKTMPIWIRQRAALTPDRIAVQNDLDNWSFKDLNDKAQLWALKLAGLGLVKGQRVALVMNNSINFIICYHALSYLGVVAVPLNTKLTPREQQWQLQDCQASTLIYDECVNTDLLAELNQINLLDSVHISKLEHLSSANIKLREEIDMDEVFTIIYTSGTTGNPKGVELTYDNHWWSAIGSALNLGLHQDDKWLMCVPMFHVSGLSIVVRSVIYGMTVFLEESFDPERVNEIINREGISIVSVVSAMLRRMLDDLGPDHYSSRLRCMLLGGGPAPMPLLEACINKSIPVFQTYGMTETASQIVTLAPEYMMKKVGSAGKPLFPATIKVMSLENECLPGEAGEIVVKGPNVTKGYYKQPAATKATIQSGWLYTGDIGYLDDEGFLYVLDRRKDLIISGGENVYPAEIESVLMSYNGVADAGVIGVKNETWGHVPIAFIQKVQGYNLDEERLLQFCRSHLASYKIPKKFHFVNDLPRNASRKLLRRKLKEKLNEC